MATLNILRKTQTEVLAKVYGSNGAVTIALADLAVAGETVNNPMVSIIAMQTSGNPGAVIEIKRGADVLYSVASESAPIIDLLALGNAADSTNGDQDIVVTTSVAGAQLLLKLRKVSGYKKA